MKDKLNKPSIFISHAWDDEAISQKVEAKLSEYGFDVITDDQILSYKGSIYDFMNEKIDKAKYIIILISENYLRSKSCMFEFTEISRNQKFSNKCFPLITKNSKIFSNIEREKYIFYWDKEIRNIETKIKNKSEDTNESNLLFYDLNICSNNKYKINNLFDYLTQMYTFEIDENSDEILKSLANALETRVKIDNQKATEDDTAK